MSTGLWAGLAGALLLVPTPSATVLRLRSLVVRGRLQQRRSLRHRRARRDDGPSRRHRRATRSEELLVAVRALVAEFQVGTGPCGALQAAAEVAPSWRVELLAAADVAQRGDPVGPTLSQFGAALRPLAAAWRVCESTGAPLAEVLRRVAGDLAAAEGQRRAVSLALAGPRSSAVLLAALPALGLALGASMGARPIAFFVGSPAGSAVAVLGVVLDVLGVIWTQRLIVRAGRSS